VRALVTGGGGFLGAALAKRLRALGHEVRSISRGEYPDLAAAGVEHLRGDIRSREETARAAAGRDVVFHAAAKAGGWGAREEFEAVNVGGTESVIAACRAAGVRALVYTSSPSVVHAGGDIAGADERLPYATRFLADYPRTKAMAERIVRAASDAALATVSLRPHFIWGPGDNHLLPRLLDRSRKGRLRRVGRGDPLVDTCYIDNCVDAHVLAAERLLSGAPLGGKVYFVSDGAPVGVWTMASRMLEAAGEPPVTRAVPAWVASAAGALLEGAHGLLGREEEPAMTRFAASQLSHAQWFDISAARRDLGYAPRVSVEEGLRRLREHLRAAAGR
jgi:nucleoside-diphosphate-sugar epimerase